MEELLNLLAQFIEQRLKKEMSIPRPRFNRRGQMKQPSQYNFVASSKLRDSVRAFVDNEDIVVIMNDYGIDYVFSDLAADRWGINPNQTGSWPGGGTYNFKTRNTDFLEKLEKWVKDKIGLQGKEAKSMAYAVRKNLFKAGYKALPLITDKVENDILGELETLLQQDRFAELMVEDILDRINIFTQEDFNLTIL